MTGNGSRFDRSVSIKANALKNAINLANLAWRLGKEADPKLTATVHAYAAAANAWAVIAQVNDSVTWQECIGLMEDDERLKGDQEWLREDGVQVFSDLIRDRLREGFGA